MKQNIIAQGAEAILIKKDNILVKDRIKKSYRHPSLDTSLRTKRTRHEARIIEKSSKFIPVPKIIKVSENKIEMSFIQGKKLSAWLDKMSEKQAQKICERIGQNISKLHEHDIVHGDLTTSNMIYNEKEDKLFFIDFGLSFHSQRIEDKAVDLHLLKQAFESKHFKRYHIYFKKALEGYKLPQAQIILKQLEKVEARGRYKKK